MKIGNYEIGEYDAIIKKIYENGSIDYETSFTDEVDLMDSVFALKRCIGKLVGIATNDPKILIGVQVIYGEKSIEKELTSIQ